MVFLYVILAKSIAFAEEGYNNYIKKEEGGVHTKYKGNEGQLDMYDAKIFTLNT